MTNISRPFQIALAAMALFVAVWFVALRGHSGGSEGAGSSASSSGGQAAAPAKAAGPGGSSSPGSVYHGSAPGVEGLTRAIAKAQGAVAQSQQNAKQQSSQAGSQATSSTGSKAPATPVKAAPKSASPSTAGARNVPARQALVEGELKHGRTVILLFWNPTGADDVAVRRQLQQLQAFHKTRGLPQNRNIAVHEARAGQVALFGAITRSLQVNQTPTMLIIAPTGNTKTLTGLADAYAIQQAIGEARHP